MPQKTQVNSTPRKLRQKKLDAFLSSSPARSTHQASPARPTRRSARRRTKTAYEDEDASGPSRVPVDEGGSQSSDAGAIRFEPMGVVISSNEEEADIPSRPTFFSRGKKRPRRAHSDDSASAVSSGGEGEKEVYVRRGKRATKKSAAIVLDSDEDEQEPQMKRRKLVKGKRPPTPEDDDVDLMDEVDEERVIDSRMRRRNKMSVFQRNLERLKRKKLGLGQAVESESCDSGSETEEDDAVPFTHARPDNGIDDSIVDDAEEAEDIFIVEDDTTQEIELPAEYSMGTYQDLLHHFKIICQLFVHIAVHDADEREEVALRLHDNQYFSVPLTITRRKLSGMRDSLVAGSTWKPYFRKALDKYPNFELQDLDFTVSGCDACHLGARKSTKLGRLSGEPYEPSSYETIVDGSDSDESGNEDERRPKKEFHLGRFCAKRTRTYHKFTHWEYHLFHALRDEVDSLKGVREERSFVRVAYAGGRQPPEDLSDADVIMDWLDERQVINILWVEVKTMMEDARHLEVKAGRGGELA